MMRIAICEDNDIERRILLELVDSLTKERGMNAEIYEFSSGEELMKEFYNMSFDIIFLDILMKQMDGIETGKSIREIDKKTEIIYCTLSADFAVAAYQVHARGYLLKPYEPRKIGELLDSFV